VRRINPENQWLCRWSQIGLQVGGRNPEARGTAWHHAYKPGYVRVEWDGFKEPRTLLSVDIEEDRDA
jgi:hypothetical protein